jgi:hypothetical protein
MTRGEDEARITAAYAELSRPTAPAEEPVAAVRRRMRRRAQRRRSLTAVVTTCVVAVVAVLTLQGVDRSLPGAGSGAEGGGGGAVAAPTGALSDSATQGCAFAYDRTTLAQRDWAVDATVTDIGPGRTTVTVQLDVNTWYRGGTGDSLRVRLPSPESGVEDAPPAYQVGSRLLLSGSHSDGPWSCGFTRYYDERTAAVWAEVFAR